MIYFAQIKFDKEVYSHGFTNTVFVHVLADSETGASSKVHNHFKKQLRYGEKIIKASFTPALEQNKERYLFLIN